MDIVDGLIVFFLSLMPKARRVQPRRNAIVRRFPLYYENPYYQNRKKYYKSWSIPLPTGTTNVEAIEGRLAYLDAMQEAARQRAANAKAKESEVATLQQNAGSGTIGRSLLDPSGYDYTRSIALRPFYTQRPARRPDPSAEDALRKNLRMLRQNEINRKFYMKYGKDKTQHQLDEDIPKNVEPFLL